MHHSTKKPGRPRRRVVINKKVGSSNDDVAPPTLNPHNDDSRSKRKAMEEVVDVEVKTIKTVGERVIMPEWQVAGVGDDQSRELQ